MESFLESAAHTHPHLEQTAREAWRIITPNFHLGWDLFLALLPLGLAWFLFRSGKETPRWIWWPLLVAFVAFLPNAPYVLTDIIHFVSNIRVTPPLPLWALSLLFLEFFLYFSIGIQSFTLSLMLWGRFLRHRGLGWLFLPTEVVILPLSALALYLGRVDRLNSWNIVTDPERVIHRTIQEAASHDPVGIMLLFLMLLTLLYYATKGCNTLVLRLLASRHHLPNEASRT